MPKIVRWHPVSHNFNRDPEIIEARKRFGDWIGYAWQECLSIGDRNNGIVPGTVEQIADILAPISLKKYLKPASKTVQIFFKYASDCGWIRIEKTHFVVLKYANYHRMREPNRLPSEPSEPIRTKPLRRRGDIKREYPADFAADQTIKNLALKNGWPDPDSELEGFKDYHIANGSRFLDWTAAFRTWLRNAKRFERKGKSFVEDEREQRRRNIKAVLNRGV